MSWISTTEVATSRYAPEGAQAVNLFNYNGVDGMTLNQLVMAVCIQRGTLMEETSVVYMNAMAIGADKISKLAEYAQNVLDVAADSTASIKDWSTIRSYLISLGVAEKDVPTDPKSYTERMAVYETIQTQMTNANSEVDKMSIELQTAISRRDTMYTMATTVTANMISSATLIAQSVKGT